MTITTPHAAPPERPATAPPDPSRPPQYSLRQIAGVWAAAALPMGLLAWVVAPWIADRLDGPAALPKALLACLTLGCVWQFLLVVILVAREQRSLRWSRVREALWLRSPHSPRTGRRGGRLWLVLIPLVLLFAAEELIPSAGHAVSRDLGLFLDSTAGHDFLAGNWSWFAVIAALAVFNTVLGEELLFRGLLLPRMEGVFGRRDWLANGVLFALYHVHMPWVMPAALLDTFAIAYPSRRYRSALIGIAVHSMQSLVLVGASLAIVLGS